MNTRLFSAYSQASKRPLATRITVIDSVTEPIKVLKILLEGITPTDETGIWITRFSGLPVARSFSPFDLVYLDDDFRVVHTAEITQTSNFVPFKGLPTSALVLPPDSIVLSKTHAGDRLVVYAYDPAASSTQPRQVIPPAKQAAKAPAPTAPASPAPRVNAVPERVQVAAPVAATQQGEVLKPAKPAQPPPAASQSPAAAAASPQIPSAPKPPVAPEPLPVRAAITTAPPAPEAAKPLPPVATQVLQPPPLPQPAAAAPAPVTTVPETAAPVPPTPAPAITPAPVQALSPAAAPVSTVAAPVPPPPPVPETAPAVPAAVPPASAAPVTVTPAPIAPVSEVPAPVTPINVPIEAPANAVSEAPEEPQPLAAAVSDQSLQPETAEAQTVALSASEETKAASSTTFDPSAVDQPWFSEPRAKEAVATEAASDDAERERQEAEEQDETLELGIQRPQDYLKAARRWDVKLLYSLFPELHPSFRPELQMPSVDPLKYIQSAKDDGRISTKIQLLSWLYPDLELETLEKRQREQRRAPRVANPGLVGYFYSSGKAEPHEISNFSVTGFYMQTEERFLPGTVIRVTLQVKGTDGTNPGDSLTLHSRVVNWDENGGGFEFVLPGFLE